MTKVTVEESGPNIVNHMASRETLLPIYTLG
jgi:hypothetical protein